MTWHDTIQYNTALYTTYSLHCSSFLRILNIKLVKPKKGTTMETIGIVVEYSPPRAPTAEGLLMLANRAPLSRLPSRARLGCRGLEI